MILVWHEDVAGKTGLNKLCWNGNIMIKPNYITLLNTKNYKQKINVIINFKIVIAQIQTKNFKMIIIQKMKILSNLKKQIVMENNIRIFKIQNEIKIIKIFHMFHINE